MFQDFRCHFSIQQYLNISLQKLTRKLENSCNEKVTLRGQLCIILCIVSGIRNRPKSDLSRNPQHCYFSLIFCAVLDSTNKYLNHCTAQNCSKIDCRCRINISINIFVCFSYLASLFMDFQCFRSKYRFLRNNSGQLRKRN